MSEEKSRQNLKKCPVCDSKDLVLVGKKQDSTLLIPDLYSRCQNCGVFFIKNRLNFPFILEKFYQERKSQPIPIYLESRTH